MNKLFFISLLFCANLGLAQTYIDVTDQYIQNPSFEEYSACPQSNSAYPSDMWVDSVVGWYAPTAGTSDYFNACNSSLNGVPNNWIGSNINSYDGNGYCGFLAYSLEPPTYGMWCEYLQTHLLQPLKTNVRYRFTMRIRRANGFNLAVQQIGANFSFVNMISSDVKPYYLTPTVLNNTGFLTDTLGWTLVSGDFKATGIENFLTIGWFGDTISNDYLFFIPPNIDPNTGDSLYLTETYYLVDSLKLYEMEYDISDFNLNVFSPNGDHVNDVIDLSVYKFKELNFVVVNRWGKIVWETNDYNSVWEGNTTSGEMLSEGTYFYRLQGVDSSGVKINKNGFVQVVR